jgi:hypothetical protein
MKLIQDLFGCTFFFQILLAPYHYLLKNPGKGIRSMIFNAFNQWLHVPKEKLAIINQVVEMLHGGSLLCVSHTVSRASVFADPIPLIVLLELMISRIILRCAGAILSLIKYSVWLKPSIAPITSTFWRFEKFKS